MSSSDDDDASDSDLESSSDDDGCSSEAEQGHSRTSKHSPAGGQAAAQALCAYLSLGICWDECLMRTCSLCWPVEGNGEAGFKAREDKGSSA